MTSLAILSIAFVVLVALVLIDTYWRKHGGSSE